MWSPWRPVVDGACQSCRNICRAFLQVGWAAGWVTGPHVLFVGGEVRTHKQTVQGTNNEGNFGNMEPRRSMLRNRWFALSSNKRPPSNLIPNDGKWLRQSWVQFNFRTCTCVVDPIQSLMVGFLNSASMAVAMSLVSCSVSQQAIRRLMIPHNWS